MLRVRGLLVCAPNVGEHRQQKIWALAAKRPYKWNLVLNLFSTELPFTRGSFTASVRDHNLREASHLYYEGKE